MLGGVPSLAGQVVLVVFTAVAVVVAGRQRRHQTALPALEELELLLLPISLKYSMNSR